MVAGTTLVSFSSLLLMLTSLPIWMATQDCSVCISAGGRSVQVCTAVNVQSCFRLLLGLIVISPEIVQLKAVGSVVKRHTPERSSANAAGVAARVSNRKTGRAITTP